MANVFGILTAIVLGLSAFIAFKNKSATVRETENLDSITATLQKNTAIETDRKDILTGLPVTRTEVDAKVAELGTQEAAQRKSNDTLSAQIETNKEKVATSKAKLDEIKGKTEKIGNIQELASKMRTIKGELEELGQSIAGAEASLANLTAQNAQAESQVNARKEEFAKLSGGESLSTVNTRIRSVYPSWGFVTLAAGNNAGIVASSTLDVVRGDEVIAKLLVTAVESNTASASIVPESLAEGVTLSPGDRVVPGIKATTPAGN